MRVDLSLQRLDGRLLFLQFHRIHPVDEAVNLLCHAVKRVTEVSHLIPGLDVHADRVIALLHPDQILMEPGHRADDGLREKE